MKEVILTDGQKAKVDDEDFDRINKHSWYPITKGTKTYAATMIDGREVLMHTMVLDFSRN